MQFQTEWKKCVSLFASRQFASLAERRVSVRYWNEERYQITSQPSILLYPSRISLNSVKSPQLAQMANIQSLPVETILAIVQQIYSAELDKLVPYPKELWDISTISDSFRCAAQILLRERHKDIKFNQPPMRYDG